MVSIRIDRRAFYLLLAVLGLGIPLALGYIVAGMMPGGKAPTSNTTAPSSQASSAAGQAQPAAAQPDAPQPDAALAAVPRISIDDAKAQYGKPDVLFYDVRTPDQYNTAHIDGATSLPEIDVANQVDKLPKDKDLILYCTWPAEEESARVAQTLLGKGFTRVKVIKGGMQAWEAAGYPMKMGTPSAAGAAGNTIQVNPSSGGQGQVVPINPGQGNQSIVVTVPASGGAAPAATP